MTKTLWAILVLNIACWNSITAQQQIRPELVNIEREEELIGAHVLMLQGKWSDAAQSLEKLREQSPTNEVFHYELAKVYAEMENFEKAFQYIEKALSLAPQNAWYHQYAAFLYHSQDKTEKELQMMKALMKLEPGQLKHYQKAAGCEVILGNADKAVDIINEYEQENSRSVASIQERFFIYEKAKNWEKAEQTLQEWVKIAPFSIAALESLAALQQDLGKTKQAAKTYQRILNIHPKHLEAQQYLFKAGQMSKDNKGLDWYADASVPVDQKIGRILSYLDAPEAPPIQELLDRSQATLEAHPDNLKPLALQSDLYYLNEDYSKALEGYYALLQEEKNKKAIFENALECAYKSGNDQYLHEIGNDMLIYFPAMIPGYYYTAIAAMRKEAWNESKQLLNEAQLMSAYDPQMQQNLAQINAQITLESSGNIPDALSILKPYSDLPKTNAFINYLHAREGKKPDLPKEKNMTDWLGYNQLATLIYAYKTKNWEQLQKIESSIHVPAELLSEKYLWLKRSYEAQNDTARAKEIERKLKEMNSFYANK